jgi:hypothetical protein
MAVRVLLKPNMSVSGRFDYINATNYKRDDRGYLTILQGTKRIAEHSPDSWTQVFVYDATADHVTGDTMQRKLDAPKARKAGPRKAPKAKTTTKVGSQIRTSPGRRKVTKKTVAMPWEDID